MNRSQKTTITDVARLAGVSKGTVDRVVHNRGDVSPKSAEKVRKAIEELNYEPNLYASLLASKKAHIIAGLLPSHQAGEYWEKVQRGFEAGAESVQKLYNVSPQLFVYDQYDPASFRAACKKVLNSEPSGVIIPPLYKTDTREFSSELSARDIPYIYVDTKLEDDAYLAYYGMPMYQSGYLCAYLLSEQCTQDELKDLLLLRVIRDKGRHSDPSLNRRAGFTDYISEHFPNCRIHSVFIDPFDKEQINKALSDFFNEHPDVKYVAMLNSRIHLISEYLSDHPLQGGRVVGFDDLEKNKLALKAGQVSLLISQQIEEQTSIAVSALADYILFHKEPPKKDNYIHMDILTKYNL